MNIIVFGGGGFIGKHLVEKLALRSERSITVFERPKSDASIQDNPFAHLENVKVIHGDFMSRDDVKSALHNQEYVFHLVSTTNPAASDKDPFIDIDTNVRSSIQLLDICAELGIKRVLFPSSGGSVYGDTTNEECREEDVPMPKSPYGIGKLTIENYLRYYKQTSGLDSITYRVANPYGPGQSPYGRQGVIPIFMKLVLEGKALTVYGDGSMIRDYIYIGDLVDMIEYSFDKDHQYDIYNLGSDKGVSVNDIIEEIRRCSNTEIAIEHKEIPSSFVHKNTLSIRRFLDEFDVYPNTNLDDGIKTTWSYVKDVI